MLDSWRPAMSVVDTKAGIKTIIFSINLTLNPTGVRIDSLPMIDSIVSVTDRMTVQPDLNPTREQTCAQIEFDRHYDDCPREYGTGDHQTCARDELEVRDAS